MHNAPCPEHARGLESDLKTMLARRQALGWLTAAGGYATLMLSGCGGGGEAAGGNANISSTATLTATSSSGSSCTTLPTETAGPYPADGSVASNQTLNALTLSNFVRSDIRTSVDTASGTATGLPLTVKVQLANVNNSCAALEGYAIYIWHCTQDGRYSMYSSSITNENYLRGVQVTDSTGLVSFQTIFPGCYLGRMPHIHFEVYPSLSKATSASNKMLTSQMAFPIATCNQVYDNVSGYSSSASNFDQISFATDNVFSDGYSTQMLSITGNNTDGYVATLTVGLAV